MASKKMTYVFDVDGTVCSAVTDGDYSRALPINERIQFINTLYDTGHTVIFQTARGMGRWHNNSALAHRDFYEMTYQQLTGWGLKFHGLFLGKPSGDIYVDDKARPAIKFFAALKVTP